MTEWQVYLGFPSLASSLNMKHLWVECLWVSYDVRGLEVVLAPALPLSGGQEVFGEGEKEREHVYICQLTSLFSKLALSLPSQAPAAWRGSLRQCRAQRLQVQTEVGSHFTLAFYKVSLLWIPHCPQSLTLHWDFSHPTLPLLFLHRSVSSRCVGTTSLNSMGSENFLEPDWPRFHSWLSAIFWLGDLG